jgi:hypothetical protein
MTGDEASLAENADNRNVWCNLGAGFPLVKPGSARAPRRTAASSTPSCTGV